MVGTNLAAPSKPWPANSLSPTTNTTALTSTYGLTSHSQLHKTPYMPVSKTKFPTLEHQILISFWLDIKENQAASDNYVQKNQQVIEKQIVIGGLRLATVIKQVFGNNTKQAPAFLQWARHAWVRVWTGKGRGGILSLRFYVINIDQQITHSAWSTWSPSPNELRIPSSLTYKSTILSSFSNLSLL